MSLFRKTQDLEPIIIQVLAEHSRMSISELVCKTLALFPVPMQGQEKAIRRFIEEMMQDDVLGELPDGSVYHKEQALLAEFKNEWFVIVAGMPVGPFYSLDDASRMLISN
ncbi:MAG: hypothetical protein JST79_08840 [Acidobacteria bacterium]|nr:hypothetical protein [Acidobacteriota bacterium]